MKEGSNKMELLGSAPVPKALMALGIPIMVGMLINALYNLADACFVGGLGERQMGAISIVFPLGQAVVGLGLMFGNGAASYLSRLLGCGDKDTANKTASTALYSSVLAGAVIIILAAVFLKPILTLLGATSTIMPYALAYARIYVLSCIFNVFNVTMNNIVTSEGAVNGYGDAVIAGMGAVARVTSMETLVVFGFLKGFQPIAEFSYGAKKLDRLREAMKTSILWSTIFCVIVGLLTAIFSTQIISRFTDGNAEMISVGQRSLIANGFSFMLFGFHTVYASLFLALGKGAAGFFLGACRQGICFVPVILILPALWGINGILYAQPIADVLSAVITVFMALHLHKELAVE